MTVPDSSYFEKKFEVGQALEETRGKLREEFSQAVKAQERVFRENQVSQDSTVASERLETLQFLESFASGTLAGAVHRRPKTVAGDPSGD